MYTFILLSGGAGLRMHNNVPKQYLMLAGKPIIMHTLKRVEHIEEIENVVLVCDSENVNSVKAMVVEYGIRKPIRYAEAGSTRQASVRSGLDYVSSEDVIIHEAARPFVREADFRLLINEPNRNVIFGIPIPFTVILGQDKIVGLLNRDELVNVQLPQKFDGSLLKEAHMKAYNDDKVFTEDASMIHYYFSNETIRIRRGQDYNIKLTTPIDLITAERIYKEYFENEN